MADYSDKTSVLAYSKHLLRGQSVFNTMTTPTATEVDTFLTRASAILNGLLASHGFTVPITSTANSTASTICDQFVTEQAVRYVELTQVSVGYAGEMGDRSRAFAGLMDATQQFVKSNALGFKRLGVPVSHESNEGLGYTALNKHSERSDPDNTSYEQPKFRRGKFDA